MRQRIAQSKNQKPAALAHTRESPPAFTNGESSRVTGAVTEQKSRPRALAVRRRTKSHRRLSTREIWLAHFGPETETGATGSESARDERSQVAQAGALVADRVGPKEEQSWDSENWVWLRGLLTMRGR
jgi:hypothetical protein